MARASDDRQLICEDFDSELERLRREGFRIDVIFPADSPHSAILSRDGATLRLTSRPDALPGPPGLPGFRPEFVVTRAGTASGAGRAGMHYRDLIPDRLGGRYVASHITIAEGGPVPDWVHFHNIAVQLIGVRKGWVRVVYEDQGEPFAMSAGDIVLQPPGIRHRVIESSPGFEAVEISCPATHETFADHGLALPNRRSGGEKPFGGQRFLHHVAATSPWSEWHGGEAQATGVDDASGGLAEARLLRRGAAPVVAIPPHAGELVFGFVLEGSVRLDHGGSLTLGPADAFAIPPGEVWSLAEMSDDFRLLHVTTARIPRPKASRQRETSG